MRIAKLIGALFGRRYCRVVAEVHREKFDHDGGAAEIPVGSWDPATWMGARPNSTVQMQRLTGRREATLEDGMRVLHDSREGHVRT